MRQEAILAIGIVGIVAVSAAFYYKTTDFTNGGEYIIEEKKVAQVEENKEKKSWFSKNKEDKKNEKKDNDIVKKEEINNETKEEKVEDFVIPEKDLSICNENGKIMVLMYHKFAKTSSDGWTRSFSDFKKDLNTLYEKNYYPINMSEYISGKFEVPYGKTPVVLTFDDGTAGQLSFEWVDDVLTVKKDTAVKVYQDFVKEHPDFPMKGTFYIMSTNFFGAKGTLKQRLEYLISQGFEIGNQTQNHYALQNADSAEKVREEVGGLAKFVDELIPGYTISSFSPPGGSMTKKYAEHVYSGTFEGFNYENKGIVLLYSSKPALSPINSELDLKKISRVRVRGNEKINNDFDYWIEYFDEHPEERYVSDGDVNTFVINADDKDKVINSNKIIIK